MASWSSTLTSAGILVRGLGLFSGEPCQVLVTRGNIPGLVFHFQDQSVHLSPDQSGLESAFADQRCTALRCGDSAILCVEHLLAAWSFFGQSSVELYLSTSEIPILDGSAWPWYEIFSKDLSLEASQIYVPLQQGFRHPFEYGYIHAEPAEKFSLHAVLNHPSGLVQELELGGDQLLSLLPARTFIDQKSWTQLSAQGFFPGAQDDSGVVYVIQDRQINVVLGQKLRYENEFVRHKMLDFLGDLALLGCIPLAKFSLYNSGHAHHLTFLKGLVHVLARNTSPK